MAGRSEIARLEDAGEITRFDPEKTAANQSLADSVIAHAKKVKDWPLLERAVELKLKEQAEFVRWWEKTVTPNQVRKSVGAVRGRQIPRKEAEETTEIKHQQVSKWRQRLKEPEKYSALVYGAAYAKAMAEVNDTTASKWTGNPESYTPQKYIEAARRVMGRIDLDPASNAFAQQTVNAGIWYDEEANGLLQEWAGNVFLNPPYSFPEIAQFIEKLCKEFGAGNVTAAVLLTNNNTDTKWWHLAAAHSSAVCFTIGRINFYKEDGSITQPTNGQTFFYFGSDVQSFAEAFSQFGLVMNVTEAAA